MKDSVIINSDFGILVNSAVRYAMGRVTYLPSTIASYIISLLPKLDDRTINTIIKDIEKYDSNVKKGLCSWGYDIDKATWETLLEHCRIEVCKRNRLTYGILKY